MSITTVHNFKLSFEQNALNNCEKFMTASEPLRADLLSQVKTVLRQNGLMISQFQDEIDILKADLENDLRSTYAHKVREWGARRQTHYENEILPREKKITFRQEQNRRLQKCLTFHTKETARREREELAKQVDRYPKRIKTLSQATSHADKAIIKAVYGLAKVLGNQSLFQAIGELVSIPQSVKRLENDRAVLESKGITCDAIPDKLHETSKEMEKLRTTAEGIVGHPYPAHRRTTTAKRLELSKVREQMAEDAARLKEGIQ